ncbi:unnamed protein product, partial [Meganyctiphanes norvegica]
DIRQDPPSSLEVEFKDITTETKNDLDEEEFISTQPEEYANKPLVVVLQSSLPRSGSTVFGQLLQTMDNNSVYFFEPLWVLRNTKCLNDESCTKNFIESIFTCSFSYSFEYLIKHNDFLKKPYSPFLRELNKTAQNEVDVRELCNSAPTRIIKLIRARLASMEDYFNLPDYNVKIVYLTRDPRGSLKSVENFGWNYDPQVRCGEVKSDIEAFKKLIVQYPSNILYVKYEDFCLDPEEIVKNIYKFLYGGENLPAQTMDYLKTHMTTETAGAMSTQKNSTAHFQLWRQSIKNSLLQNIEGQPECRYLIDWMGHNLFGNDVNATNYNITLFKDI